MTKFNPGDIVRLKSGGPAMTVVCRSRYTHTEVTIFAESPDEAPLIWADYVNQGQILRWSGPVECVEVAEDMDAEEGAPRTCCCPHNITISGMLGDHRDLRRILGNHRRRAGVADASDPPKPSA